MSTLAAHGGLAGMPHGLRVEVVSEFDAFLRLKDGWDALADAGAAGHPFATHEWLRIWWECFGKGRTLHIVVVREKNSVVGVAPMMEEAESFYGFRLRKLALIWNRQVPHCDFILDPDRADIYKALWKHFVAENHKWDLLLLPQVPGGSATLRWFETFADESGFLAGFWDADSAPYVPLSGTWQEFLESPLPKRRADLRRGTARVLRVGTTVEQEELSADDGDRADGLAEGMKMEVEAWKGAAGMFIYPNNPGTALFHAMRFRLKPTGRERDHAPDKRETRGAHSLLLLQGGKSEG